MSGWKCRYCGAPRWADDAHPCEKVDLDADGKPHYIMNIATGDGAVHGGMLSYTSDGEAVIVRENGAYDKIIDVVEHPVRDTNPLYHFNLICQADAVQRIAE